MLDYEIFVDQKPSDFLILQITIVSHSLQRTTIVLHSNADDRHSMMHWGKPKSYYSQLFGFAAFDDRCLHSFSCDVCSV
jgi:hypothetical protein